jgi:hypothetical protein
MRLQCSKIRHSDSDSRPMWQLNAPNRLYFGSLTVSAATLRYVAFLSGLAHITLPHSIHEAYILGGKHGLILAADTAAVSAKGHMTNYPSDSETTALQLETRDGKVPPHRVLHAGPCFQNETVV